MTRTLVIAGLIAALALTVGGPGLSIASATAEMMQTDMSMMKATGVDLMALRTEITAIQAELQRLTARAGAMTKMVDRAASDYCASVPDALLATGFVPGLSK
jgi:hypothetical protein